MKNLELLGQELSYEETKQVSGGASWHCTAKCVCYYDSFPPGGMPYELRPVSGSDNIINECYYQNICGNLILVWYTDANCQYY